jgi:Fic-DOC domain mobile mystery protein B
MSAVAERPITADEAALLLPSLTTRAQLLEVERLNIHGARVWAMQPGTLGRTDLLSLEFLRELHRKMFRRVWKGSGNFRSATASRGWEPATIEDGVRLFLDDAEGWMQYSTYPVHECAVRLHHRLVSVRPWSNGNGRHARLMADVVVAAMSETPLTWGSREPGGRSPRSRYIEAITVADNGDMAALLAFARS